MNNKDLNPTIMTSRILIRTNNKRPLKPFTHTTTSIVPRPGEQVAMLTGRKSMMTVIDLDGFIPEFKALNAKYKWGIDMNVKTRKGFHIYCYYNNKLGTWARAPYTSTGEKIEIDIRNDQGYVCCPPSPGYTMLSDRINVIKPTLRKFLMRDLTYNPETKSLEESKYKRTKTTANALEKMESKQPEDVPKFENHSFRSQQGEFYLYDRKAPSHCDICNRTHDNDNTLYLTKEEGQWVEHCRRSANSELMPEYKPEAWESIQIEMEKETIDAKYMPPIGEYIDDNDVVGIASNMGTGKSYQLIKYLQESKLKDYLMISFRKTFTKDIERKFQASGLELNSYIGCTNFKQKNMIVQAESMWKYDIEKRELDLLIIDEFVSVRHQMLSPLQKKQYDSFARFEWCIKYAKRVVIMDANLSDDDMKMLHQIRAGKYFMLRNTYNNVERTIYDFGPRNDKAWEEKLIGLATEGKNIFVVSTRSAERIEALRRRVEAKTERKCMAYTSRNTYSEQREADFSNVNVGWKQYAVVFVSPSVTAGVDFNEDHFDHLFMDLYSASCDVNSTRQMMNRVRNFRSPDAYLTYRHAPQVGGLPDTLPKIENELKRNYKRLVFDAAEDEKARNAKDQLFSYKYGRDGTWCFPKTAYYWFWCINKLEDNISKNNFLAEFLRQEKLVGVKYVRLDTKKAEALDLAEEIAIVEAEDVKKLTEVETVARYAIDSCGDMAEGREFIALKAKQSSDTITETESLILQKSYLLSRYNMDRNRCIPDSEVMEAWITTYKSRALQNQYYNLAMYQKFKDKIEDGSIAATIADMKLSDQTKYRDALNRGLDKTYILLNRSQSLHKIAVVLTMLEKSGMSADILTNPGESKIGLPDEKTLGMSYKSIYDTMGLRMKCKKMSSRAWISLVTGSISKTFGVTFDKGVRRSVNGVRASYFKSNACDLFRPTYDEGDEYMPSIRVFE